MQNINLSLSYHHRLRPSCSQNRRCRPCTPSTKLGHISHLQDVTKRSRERTKKLAKRASTSGGVVSFLKLGTTKNLRTMITRLMPWTTVVVHPTDVFAKSPTNVAADRWNMVYVLNSDLICDRNQTLGTCRQPHNSSDPSDVRTGR